MRLRVLSISIALFGSGLIWASVPEKAEDYKDLKQTAFSKQASLGERWEALQKMSEDDFSIAQSDVVKALQDKEWFIRNAALVALRNGKKELVVEWSEKLLFDKALVVRTQAIKNLIEVQSETSGQKIFKALNDKMNFRGAYSLWVRPYMAQALVLQPPANWKNVYQNMLADSDQKVQAWAVIGLEKKSGLRLGGADDPLEVKRQKWMNYFGLRQH